MKILGYIVLGLFVIMFIASREEPKSFQEKMDQAHKDYNSPQRERRVSDLPRGSGKTRGDDYANCMSKRFYREQSDPEDFCRWHAGMGKYFKK